MDRPWSPSLYQMALENFMLFFLATVVSILLESITMGSRSDENQWHVRTSKTIHYNYLKRRRSVSFLHGKSCLKKLWQTKKVVNCSPNNNFWLANLSHVPPNVSDSTEKKRLSISKTLHQRWLTPFCIILTRTSSSQVHVSHLLPSFIVILNVGLSPASVTNCSSVIATGKGRIESSKYRWVSEPALYATQWELRRFWKTPLHLRISHAVLIARGKQVKTCTEYQPSSCRCQCLFPSQMNHSWK